MTRELRSKRERFNELSRIMIIDYTPDNSNRESGFAIIERAKVHAEINKRKIDINYLEFRKTDKEREQLKKAKKAWKTL
jgi:hypothetical protein